MDEIADTQQLLSLAVALAIGLLVGTERGWRSREAVEGQRIAGVRTLGLVGLLGGCAGLLSQYLGQLILAFAFFAFTLAATVVYVVQRRDSGDVSMTSLIAMLLTFTLGAMATVGPVLVAASAAVIATLLLRFKIVLHGWLEKLEQRELHAMLQLLLITVVMLPVLPDQGYGPWQALNPYEIWWMVVLIASISFSGYFAIKLGGAEKGTMLASLFAGLVSSTALTLHFSRLARAHKGMETLLAAGILVACGTMFPRVLLVASLINPKLFTSLVAPMLVMTLFVYLPAIYLWRHGSVTATEHRAQLQNPLELRSALAFGGLLALVVLLSKALKEAMGEAGIYAVAAASGIIDVDALNLSLSRMSLHEIDIQVAILGIVIAAASNTTMKALFSAFIGGSQLGRRVALPLLLASIAGLITAIP